MDTLNTVLLMLGSGAAVAVINGLVSWRRDKRKRIEDLEDRKEAKADKRSEMDDTVKDAVRLIMHDRLMFIGKSHIRTKHISVDDLKTILQMYEIYRDKLGGNGVIGYFS